MNIKVRDQLLRRQRRVARRLSKASRQSSGPVFDRGRARFEVSDRMRATSAGGLRLAHELANAIDLPREIDARVTVLKLNLPYSESEHQRRSDEDVPDMLGAERIPDPTTAGDF